MPANGDSFSDWGLLCTPPPTPHGVVPALPALLQGDYEVPEVIRGDGRDVLVLAQEIGEVAHAGSDPLDGTWAAALGLSADAISCQRVGECSHGVLLLLTAYIGVGLLTM
jgi:hypothetical protein